MARYAATVTTDRPPEEAFDYLADFSSVSEWDPGVREARRLDGGEVREGARFEVVARFLGRDVPLVYETVELDRPRRVVVRATSDSVVSTDAIDFRALPGGGTAVTYQADLRLQGVLRAAELPMRLAFRRIGDRARSGLDRALA